MEIFSALLSLCEGNPPVTGFPSQRPVTRSFYIVFFNQRLDKRLVKQSKRRWFERLSRSLWRHCNARVPVSHHWGKIMVIRQFDAKLISEPVTVYCLVSPIWIDTQTFSLKKMYFKMSSNNERNRTRGIIFDWLLENMFHKQLNCRWFPSPSRFCEVTLMPAQHVISYKSLKI